MQFTLCFLISYGHAYIMHFILVIVLYNSLVKEMYNNFTFLLKYIVAYIICLSLPMPAGRYSQSFTASVLHVVQR